MSAHTRFMCSLAASTLPQSTSSVMAPIMARQFCHLQATGAGNTPPSEIPPSVTTQGISTPLRSMTWQQALAQHPHREWVASLLEGMQNGFRIGLNPTTECRSSARNHPSADKHPVVVLEYLRTVGSVMYESWY